MARDFVINGPTLVMVKGSEGNENLISLAELGLAQEGVRVVPRFYHQDTHVDDFGPDCPADVLWDLAEVTVHMTLIHYDDAILTACVNESMGGAVTEGTLVRGGTPLGGGHALFDSSCHFISLNLTSPALGRPWRFPGSFLTGEPVEFALGTEKTAAVLRWRCIPYGRPESGLGGEVRSRNQVLWARSLDVNTR